MKAVIVSNLVEVIDNYFAGSEGHRTDKDFLALAERIAGREVTLVFICGDAFEKEDRNYWLPEVCWVATEEEDEDQLRH